MIIVLRLRQAACSKRWTKESVLKEIEARKNLSKGLKTEGSTSTETSSPVKLSRAPRVTPRDNANLSIKKRRQSYLRTPSVQEELDEEINSVIGNEPSLTEEGEEDENESEKILEKEKEKEREKEREKEKELEKEKEKNVGVEDSVEALVELWFNT